MAAVNDSSSQSGVQSTPASSSSSSSSSSSGVPAGKELLLKLLSESFLKRQFLLFLKSIYSEETLLFYDDVEEYKAMMNPIQRVEKAQAIFDTYLRPSAEQLVNVQARFTPKMLADADVKLFDKAQREAFDLMDHDVLFRFKKSTYWSPAENYLLVGADSSSSAASTTKKLLAAGKLNLAAAQDQAKGKTPRTTDLVLPANNPEDQHMLSIDQVCDRYQCNRVLGLSADERKARLKKFGPNVMAKMYTKEQLDEVRRWEEGLPNSALVRVNGDIVVKESRTLVPGDVVVVQEGDIVSADMRIIEATNLSVNMNQLIGERDPKMRTTRMTDEDQLMSANMLLSSSNVLSGTGTAIVVATGDDTIMGRTVSGAMTQQQEPLLRSYPKKVQKLVEDMWKKHHVWVKGVEALRSLHKITHLVMPVQGVISFLSRMEVERVALDLEILPAVQAAGAGSANAGPASSLLTSASHTHAPAYTALFRAAALVNAVHTDPVDRTTVISTNHIETSIYAFLQASRSSTPGDAGDQFDLNAVRDAFPRIWLELYDKQSGMQFSVHKVAARETPRSPRPGDGEANKKPMASTTNMRTDSQWLVALEGQPERVIECCSHMHVNGKLRRIEPDQRRKLTEMIDTLASSRETVVAFAMCVTDPSKYPASFSWDSMMRQFTVRRFTGTQTARRAAAEQVPQVGAYTLLGLLSLVNPLKSDIASSFKRLRARGIKLVFTSSDLPATATSILSECGIIATRLPLTDDPRTVSVPRDVAVDGEQLSNFLPNGNTAYAPRLFEQSSAVVIGRIQPQQKLWVLDYLREKLEPAGVVCCIAKWKSDIELLQKADVGSVFRGLGPYFMKEASDLIIADNKLAAIADIIEWIANEKQQKSVREMDAPKKK